MSERKTSEIKLRVTPSFKAAVQLAAEQAGETMSVYMETATQDRISQKKQIDRVAKFAAQPNQIAGSDDAWRFTRFPAPSNPPVAQNPVPAKSADGACEKNCAPWQWCSCRSK